jgi:hypothetical protein
MAGNALADDHRMDELDRDVTGIRARPANPREPPPPLANRSAIP